MINPGRGGVQSSQLRNARSGCRAAGSDVVGDGLHFGGSCDIGSPGNGCTSAHIYTSSHVYAVSDVHPGTHRNSRADADASANGNFGSASHSNAGGNGPGGVDGSL